VVFAFGAVAIRINVARASDYGMVVGEHLLLAGDTQNSGAIDGDVYHVHLNGQTLESTNTTTDLPMTEVLTYVADQCKSHATGLSDAFQHLDRAIKTKEATTGVEGAMVVHEEYGERGYVFCVAPDRPLSIVDLARRLGDVQTTGDFSSVGHIRYVAVRQPKGAAAHVVAVWNDAPFEVAKMFPDDADAPGVDFGAVPRLEGSLRTLSANIEGAPSGVNAYAVKGSPKEVLAALDHKLAGAGWKATATAKKVPDSAKGYSLGSSTDLVVLADDASKGMTNLTYVVSRAIPSVSR
jgi:hypothetical protein